MSLRRSFGWTGLQFVAVLTIELGGLAILARILTPEDMGAYAAAFALLRLAMFLGGFGLNTVLIRATEVDELLRRQIVGIAVLTTAVILTIYALGYWLIPVTEDSAEYRMLLLIMLPVALISCVSSPANAMLQRQMRFRSLFWARGASTLAYQALAIPFALAGWGATSLAFGMVGSSVAFATLATIMTGREFLIRPSLKGAGGTLRFASVIFGTNAANEAREVSVVLLVGKLAGLAPLGILSRARDLVVKANTVLAETIMPVLVPHVYKSARDGQDLVANFRVGWSYLSAICLPAAAGLALLAPAIVAVLLGDQWGEVGAILSVLALGIALQPLAIMTGTYLVAMGGEKRQLAISLFHLAMSFVIVVLTARDGLVDMALLLVLAQMVQLTLLLLAVAGKIAIGPALLWRASWRSVLLGLATGLPIWVMHQTQVALSVPGFIAVGFLAGCCCWLIALVLLRHPFLQEIGILARALRARQRDGFRTREG